MKTLFLITFTIMLAVFAYEMLGLGKHQQLSQMREAYALCKQAPTKVACANAQAITHTEYVCSNTGCWLEVK